MNNNFKCIDFNSEFCSCCDETACLFCGCFGKCSFCNNDECSDCSFFPRSAFLLNSELADLKLEIAKLEIELNVLRSRLKRYENKKAGE